MKFLHIGDLHIGKSVNGYSMIEDQRFALDSIIRMANTHEVDALLLAGDLYDKSTPSAEATALLDYFLTEVVSSRLKVFAIPGNHDSAERVAYARQMLQKTGVYIAPDFDGEMTKVTITDEYGPLNIWLMPFVKPANVRPYFPDDAIDTYTDAVRIIIDNAGIPEDDRNIILAHQFIISGGVGPERSDSELSIGGLDSVDAGVFDLFDYVALGHIHRPQRIGRDTCRYSGSLLKYSFSEINYPKSSVLLDVGEKGAPIDWKLLPITPLHDMREIKGPFEELISPEVVAAANSQDYLHVILTDETPILDALSRVRQTYPNTMALEYDNTSTRHAASATMATLEEVQKLDTFELFAEFFNKQHGKDLSNEQCEMVEATIEDL